MNDGPNRLPAALWGLAAALIGVIAVGVVVFIPLIDDDLRSRTQAALEDAGLAFGVDVDGRDVTLTGSSPNAPDIELARELVRNVRGVRSVSSAVVLGETLSAPPITLTIELPPAATGSPTRSGLPTLSINASGDTVVLSGIFPDQVSIDALVAQAAERYGPDNVVNNLQLSEDTEDADWVRIAPGLIIATEQLDPWSAAIEDDQRLVLRGSAPNPDAARIGRASVNGLMSEYIAIDLDVTSRIAPPRGLAGDLTDLLAEGGTFEVGSAAITAEARARLDRAIAILLANPSAELIVASHTDDIGDAAANLSLSQARAEAVVEYLVAGGINSERLSAVGYGETQPIADNTTESGRAINRRIEFIERDT